MEHGCSQHRVGTCFDGGREVLDLAGTAGGDDRNLDFLAHGANHLEVKAFLGAVGVHRVKQNLAGAIDAGLDVGVYFFSQAMDEQEAREEARFVLDKISGYQLAYPVFFDWEKIGADARSDAMDLTSLTTVTDTFCSEIEAAGYQAGLYFNQQLGYEELHLPSLQGYTFWLAEYNDTPSFTYDFDLWQYASDGSVDGIDGDVDLNLAFIGK